MFDGTQRVPATLMSKRKLFLTDSMTWRVKNTKTRARHHEVPYAFLVQWKSHRFPDRNVATTCGCVFLSAIQKLPYF